MTVAEVITIGQRWVSRDPRDSGRTVEVEAISDRGREMIGSRGQRARVRNIETGRRTVVLLETLRAKYRIAFDQKET